jgi:FkbM family methyltransferase
MLEPELGILPILTDPDRTSLGVGASAGLYTAALLPLSRDVCYFEPAPSRAEQLTRQFKECPTAKFYPVALSDRVGIATLRVPIIASLGEWTPMSTIEAGNRLADSPTTDFVVPTMTIDSLRLEDVGFIKIDTEGHELAVLEGAAETLSRWRPNLVIEAEERHRPGAVESTAAFLRRFGYHGCFRANSYNEFLPVAAFDPAVHQAANKVDSSDYCANFVFSISAHVIRSVGTAILARLPDGFDSAGYLSFNQDVAAGNMNAAAHYMAYGWREGRKWRAA